MKYRYGILRVDGSKEAEEHNAKLLGDMTLGFEVTSSFLAVCCGLGNIDPQHHEGGGSSAIEEALTFEPLPPEGACFVTIRPDRDSLGAEAVILLRAEDNYIDTDLVEWVGLVDRVGFHNAKNMKPEWAKLLRQESDAMQAIVNELRESGGADTEKAVMNIARILSHKMSEQEINAFAACLQRNYEDFEFEKYSDKVTFIVAPGKYDKARQWGNRRFPVTVVFDPKYQGTHGVPYARWTVIRQPGVCDRWGLQNRMNELEAEARGISVTELKETANAWAGNPNIMSSAQGRETALTKETILPVVREFAESGMVS